MASDKDQQTPLTPRWTLYQKQSHLLQANNTLQIPTNNQSEDCDCDIVYEKPTIK